MEAEPKEFGKVASDPVRGANLYRPSLSTPLLPSQSPPLRRSLGATDGVTSCPPRQMASRRNPSLCQSGTQRSASGQRHISESLERLPRSGTLDVILDSSGDSCGDSNWSEISERSVQLGDRVEKRSSTLTGDKVEQDHAVSVRNNWATVALTYVSFLFVAAVYGRIYRRWSVVDSIYFAVVTAHTVGYGDLTMQDDNESDCMLAALYVLVGVAMLGIVVGESIVKFFESHEDRVSHLTHEHHWRWHIFFGTVEVLLPLVLGTVGFAYLESKQYSQSLYWAVSTASTVGYGDLVPVTEPGKLFTVLYVPLSIALLVTGVASFARVPMELRRSRFLSHLTQDAFTYDVFEELANGSELQRLDLSQDAECITRNEFCLFLLHSLGKISEEDLTSCQNIFSKLDRTRNGKLTLEDVEMIKRERLPDIAKDLLEYFDKQFQPQSLPEALCQKQLSPASVRKCRSAAPALGRAIDHGRNL